MNHFLLIHGNRNCPILTNRRHSRHLVKLEVFANIRRIVFILVKTLSHTIYDSYHAFYKFFILFYLFDFNLYFSFPFFTISNLFILCTTQRNAKTKKNKNIFLQTENLFSFILFTVIVIIDN